MTAFPFGPALTLRELRARLVAEHGCTFETMPFEGGTAAVLRRFTGDHTEIAALPDANEDRVLAPALIRSICGQLGIDPAALDLDD